MWIIWKKKTNCCRKINSMKIPFKPGTLIYPLPAVMVTCGDCEENYNIITIHLRPQGTPLARTHHEKQGIRHQPDDGGFGHRHRLVRRALRPRLQQIQADALAYRACPNRESPFDCRVAVEHRVQGGGSEGIRFARYVHR